MGGVQIITQRELKFIKFIKNIKLQTKLVTLFSTLFIVCMGFMGFLSYEYCKQGLKEVVFRHVEHISGDLADRLESFFYERLISIKTTATSMYIRTRLKEINFGKNDYQQLVQQICQRLEQLKRDDPCISELFVLDPKGKIIASTNKNQTGKDKSDCDYFKKRLSAVTDIYISPTLRVPTMVASSPLIDEGSATFLGMVVARVNLKDFGELVGRISGKTISQYNEEVYIVNKDSFFLAGHISEEIIPLKRRFYSKGIENCLIRQQDGVDIYPNYRGALVIGGYRYLKEKQWILMAEMSLEQAVKPVYNLRNWFLTTGVILNLIVIAFTIGLSKGIIAPLLKLTTASHEIAAGNLDVSVEVKGNDEIGLLADSFNSMVRNLRNSTQKIENGTKQLKEAQAQLVQSAKMAAVGQLGAGVAHELNNPLGGILGYAQFILEKFQEPEFGVEDFKASQKYIEHIEREAARCKKIVESLLDFSRRPIHSKPEPIDIAKTIEETLSIMGHQLKLKNINVVNEIKPDLVKVMGILNQIQQVFTNVIINAVQAMPEGGTLRISSENITDESTQAPSGVKIEFTDTGCGIPEEILSKIFEPFFTTRIKEKGTGLGLSVSYQIIQEHKGTVEVESQVGKGTTFTITLPTVELISSTEKQKV